MKKIFLSAIMALAALTSVNAQNQEAGKFSLMPHLGGGYTNMSCLVGETDTKFADFVTGIVGGEAKYQISDVIGISAGMDLTYSECLDKKSVDVPVDGISVVNYSDGIGFSKYKSVSVRPYFAYLSFPVLVQANIGKHFGIKAGVQTNVFLTAKAGDDDNLKSIKDNFKSTMISIPVGVSYTFNLPITMDLRYNIPVTKATIYDKTANTVSLTVGYRFDLGK